MNKQLKIAYPSSTKIYMKGEMFPNLRIGMRQINLTPTVKIVDGKKKTYNKQTCYSL